MCPNRFRPITSGVRILIYSGDVDSVCPITGTRYWLASMNMSIVSPWVPWYSTQDQQVAGWTVKYANLTFASVRNSGHFVSR